MIGSLPPVAIFLVGALLVAATSGRVRAAILLAIPVVGALNLATLAYGTTSELALFGYTLTPLRVDRLSFLFGLLFHLAAFIGFIFSLHVKDRVQVASSVLYAGAAIGAVFAGDLISLVVFWELLALTSVFLILARRTERAYRASMRYLLVQLTAGVMLIAGVVIHISETGSLAFGYIGLGSLSSVLIFLAFGIKCGFPLLHNWLTDAYPEATPTGAVFLSAFTTKVAIYGLARAFPGTEMLIYIGAVMTMFPIFFAVIENDLRRVLAYSMINQLGFMVCGIGLGTELAINGAVSHAFNDVIFKGLLFMSMGAVLFRTGKINGSELGGLYKSMPWTTAFCIVGAASISAFPLFSGFVSKSMVMVAAIEEGHPVVWLIAALRLRRRLPPRRHQDSVLRVLRARLGHPHPGSAAQHADRHGAGRRRVRRERRLSLAALLAAALPGTLRALHGGACAQPVPASLLLGACLHLAQALGALSARTAQREHRRRLAVSPRGACRGRPCRRRGGDCAPTHAGLCRACRFAPSGDRLSPSRAGRRAGAGLADGQHGLLGDADARRISLPLLHPLMQLLRVNIGKTYVTAVGVRLATICPFS